VCDPQGRVVDVIPGMCDPETYVRELGRALALWERNRGDFGAITAWHEEQSMPSLEAADRALAEPELPSGRRLDVSKALVEDPLKRAMRRDRELLAEDGRRNLIWRRPVVHELLMRRAVRPADITRELYRAALHVDLDDPYLGLDGGPFGGGAYGGFDLDVLRRAGDPPR
jgi:hypothetical protein